MSLSKYELTNDDFDASFEEMYSGSDRVSVILGAALVELELRSLFKMFLPNISDETALLDDRGAPLGTLSNLILMGKALNLFPPELADEMHVVRRVRNDFAHRLLSLNFEHSAVIAECKKLAPRTSRIGSEILKPARDDISEWRHRYEGACHTIAITLLKKQNEIQEERARIAIAIADEAARDLLIARSLSNSLPKGLLNLANSSIDDVEGDLKPV